MMDNFRFYAECDDCAFDVGSAPTGGATAADCIMSIRLHAKETGHLGFGVLLYEWPAKAPAAPAVPRP